MNEGVGHALDQALAFWRAPALLANARHRPLPDDVLEVVRIAAGDGSAAGQGAQATGADERELTEAAAFYLQQLLFAPGTDSYRVLGVNAGADDARIKEHYRWLVRWLHPDRNPDEWEAMYADRVNRAWQDLRTPDKRAAYDAGLEAGKDFAPEGAPTGAAPPPVGAPSGARPFPQTPRPLPVSEPLLSARTTRKLPYLVLGGFGALAGAVLMLMWYAQGIQPSRVLPPTSAPAPTPTLAVTPPETPPTEPLSPAAQAPSAALTPPPPIGDAYAQESPAIATPTPASAPSPVRPRPIAAVPQTETPPPAAPRPVAATAVPEAKPRPIRIAAAEPTRITSRAPPAVATAPVPTQTKPPVTAAEASPEILGPPPITESAAQVLLDQFTRAYARGDLSALMRLFSSDATNNRGGRDAIAYDYQELFDDTRKRQIILQRQGWLQSGDTATVLARFEARVTPAGSLLSRSSQGNIRFDLGWENGSLRIRGVRHDER